MKFRLTYAGPLRPTQRDARDQEPNPLAPHKHAVRRAFHKQVKQLWHTNKFLREGELDSRLYPSYRPDESTLARLASSQTRYVPLPELRVAQASAFCRLRGRQ